MRSRAALRHPLLEACGVEHGFGLRDAPEPPGLCRPRQVHGARVARVDEAGRPEPGAADAIVATQPGRTVAIVTADCVPVLAASEDGHAVAAIHAGWRGLAAGVVEAGIAVLRGAAPPGVRVVAVVGPHVRPPHYEVDTPVLDALRARFGEAVDSAAHATRRGHAQLELGVLVQCALQRAGLGETERAELPGACTYADPERFHSYRRDGARAGRLVHHVAPRAADAPRPKA